MNALEMLLQRIRAPGTASDPDWQAYLAEMGEALPPRDEHWLAPGQVLPQDVFPPDARTLHRSRNQPLHPNAAGIYAAPRPPPPGDVVLPSGDPAGFPVMPRVADDASARQFGQQFVPSYLPGPYGSTRISAGQGLPRGGQPTAPQGMPSQNWARIAEEMLERMWRDPSLVGSMNRMTGTPTPPQTTFSEGDRIPPEAAGRGYQTLGQPLFDQELAARLLGGQREQRLFGDIQGGRELGREGVWPMPEGDVQSFSPNSPYSSPLNQMLQRPPFGLY